MIVLSRTTIAWEAAVFLLHGLHYLKDDSVMAIILPHGVLFPASEGY